MGSRVQVFLAAAFLAAAPVFPAVIDFDDFTTTGSFFDLGIANTYEGFVWSNSLLSPATGPEGWGATTVSTPVVGPAPTGGSGNGYAWTWGGPQSLFIQFGTPTNFNSVLLATLSSSYGSNASTVQLFGYNAANTLVATGSILTLTDAFQLYTANFTGINTVELRSNSESTWFSIDDITINGSAVPEPGSALLLALGTLAIAGLRRFRGGQ